MGDKVIKKFKVLKNCFVDFRCAFSKGSTIEAELINSEKIYKVDSWLFHFSWIDFWIENGSLEEVTDKPLDKNIVSSSKNTNGSDDIYSKKYNIYEILTLIPNLPKDTKFKCSLDEDVIWHISDDEDTLIMYDDDKKEIVMLYLKILIVSNKF